jgi:hypothetical protein
MWNPLAINSDNRAFHVVMVLLSTCGLFNRSRQRVDERMMTGLDINVRQGWCDQGL